MIPEETLFVSEEEDVDDPRVAPAEDDNVSEPILVIVEVFVVEAMGATESIPDDLVTRVSDLDPPGNGDDAIAATTRLLAPPLPLFVILIL